MSGVLLDPAATVSSCHISPTGVRRDARPIISHSYIKDTSENKAFLKTTSAAKFCTRSLTVRRLSLPEYDTAGTIRQADVTFLYTNAHIFMHKQYFFIIIMVWLC